MSTQWNEERLLALISDQIEEADQLEYKSAKSLQKGGHYPDEIGKDVSAFANAGGGTLIYGIKEFADPDRKHLPEQVDPVDRVAITREWLEHQIARIEPRIAELKITPVPLSTGEKHVAYVVEIPKSITAHQAPGGKYYRRYNFEAQWMKDHEIRDVMSRRKYPKVQSSVMINLFNPDIHKRGGLVWTVTNESDVFCQHVAATIHIPLQYKSAFLAFDDGYFDSDSEGRTFWRLKASNAINHPLFPRGTIIRRFKAKLIREIEFDDGRDITKAIPSIHVRTFADSAPHVDQDFATESVIKVLPP